MKVYVVIERYDYNDDGWTLFGVFKSRWSAQRAVYKKHPKAVIDEDGDMKYKIDNWLTSDIYFDIEEVSLQD